MKQLGSARGCLLLYIVAGILTTSLLTTGRVDAQTPALEGRIAFVDPEGQLATVAPNGSDLRVLSEAGRVVQFPAWSPEGDKIAAITVDTAADAPSAAVYTFTDTPADASSTSEDAAPVELYRSAEEPPIYLYWSPGGKTVAFIANRSGADGGGTLGLHLASLREGSSRLLATGNPFYWDWSADGSSLFIHTGFTGEGARLTFISAEGDPNVATGGGAEQAEANLAQPGFFQAPGISPSGRFVAYAERDALGRGRVVVRENPGFEGASASEEGSGEGSGGDNGQGSGGSPGGNSGGDGAAETVSETAREFPHEGLVALGWSPTEDVLALSSPPAPARAFYGPIRLLDARTGDLSTLANELSVAFFWSPDGRYLAYLSPFLEEGGDVAGGLSDAPLAQLASFQAQPQLPFLNLTVVEVASFEVRLRTSFLPTSLFLGQFLPFFDQYALSHSLWSPESNAIVLPTLEADGPHLLVLPLEGEARTIAAGDTPFWSR